MTIAEKTTLIEKLAIEIKAELEAQLAQNPSELLLFKSQIAASLIFSAGDMGRKAGMLKSNYVPSKDEKKAKAPKWGKR